MPQSGDAALCIARLVVSPREAERRFTERGALGGRFFIVFSLISWGLVTTTLFLDWKDIHPVFTVERHGD